MMLIKIKKWVVDKTKRFWKWITIAVVGATVLASTITPLPATFEQTLIQEQDDYFKVHGKYKHVPKQIIDGKEVIRHEYQAPTGNGYQIIIKDGDTTTSIGSGVEALSRTWTKTEQATSTSFIWEAFDLFSFGQIAQAANTHSIDLESGSSQWLSRTDGDQTGLDIQTDMTVEAWVKLESAPGNNVRYFIAGKGDSGGTDLAYLLEYKNDGGTDKLFFSSSTGCSAGTTWTWADANDLGSGTWFHVAAAYDVSAGSVEFFLDGTSVGNPGGGNTSIGNCTSDFTIGAVSGGGNYFDGLIDEVRVWDDLRTSTEIDDNKCTEIDSAANLQGSWHLNNALTDSSGNGNTLTNNNSAVFSTDHPFDSAKCPAAAAADAPDDGLIIFN